MEPRRVRRLAPGIVQGPGNQASPWAAARSRADQQPAPLERPLLSRRALLGALGGALAATCGPALGCRNEPPDLLRLGTDTWVGYDPLHHARVTDLLHPKLQIIELPSSSEVARSLRNGALDAAGLSLDETLFLAQTDADLLALLVVDTSNGADAVIGGPAVRALADLRGRRVGAEVTALAANVLARALEAAGLGPRDVTVLPMGVHQQEAALSSGRVDAAVTFEPMRSRLLSAGGHLLFDSRQMPGQIVDLLVVRRSFVLRMGGRNRPLVRALAEGWFAAVERMAARPADMLPWLTRHLGAPLSETTTALSLMKFGTRALNAELLGGRPPPLRATAEALASLMRERRLMTRQVDFGTLFDDDLRRELLA